jgi:hypothetical protein
MAESRPYENKAHRAAKLIIPRWPGWEYVRDKLQYAAYYENPRTKKTHVYAYAYSPMRPTGWMDLFWYTKYYKIEGLFEGVERYQELKKQGRLTEYGTAPRLRGPRPWCVKPRKRARAAEEDEAAVEASPCEAEAAAPEEHEHREDKENKELRAQASAAAAARAMLAVRAAWGQHQNNNIQKNIALAGVA